MTAVMRCMAVAVVAVLMCIAVSALVELTIANLVAALQRAIVIALFEIGRVRSFAGAGVVGYIGCFPRDTGNMAYAGFASAVVPSWDSLIESLSTEGPVDWGIYFVSAIVVVAAAAAVFARNGAVAAECELGQVALN